MPDPEPSALRKRLNAWCNDVIDRCRAMAIVASMTLPAFGLRAYQTRELKDVYGATDVPPEVPPKPPGPATH
jgi:hypothetical protein